MEDEEAPYIEAEPCPCEKSKSKTVLEKDRHNLHNSQHVLRKYSASIYISWLLTSVHTVGTHFVLNKQHCNLSLFKKLDLIRFKTNLLI